MNLTFTPTEKQHEALQVLQDTRTKVVVYGGAAGGGKSILGCMWLTLQCLQYPGVKYFVGRNTLKEIRMSTVPSFVKLFNLIGLTQDKYNINGQDNSITFSNGSRIDLINCDKQPSDPFYERFGSLEYSAGWLEEAGEISFEAFDTLKSRIGRQLNDKYNIPSKILLTCNPKRNFIYEHFVKPWQNGEHDNTFNFISAKVSDNNFIDSMYIENLYSISDNIKRARLLEGNWEYDNDPTNLVEYDKISDIFTNSASTSGKRYISADIANIGGDRTVIMVWNGLAIEKIVKMEKADTTQVAGKIRELANVYNIGMSNVIVDANGLGVGVKDILKCKGFINNGKPTKDVYDMIKSECGYKLAELISSNLVSCITMIDNDTKESIITELTLLKQYQPDNDNKLKLIPKHMMKNKLGRSPDYLDCMLMRMYYELHTTSRPMMFSIKTDTSITV